MVMLIGIEKPPDSNTCEIVQYDVNGEQTVNIDYNDKTCLFRLHLCWRKI